MVHIGQNGAGKLFASTGCILSGEAAIERKKQDPGGDMFLLHLWASASTATATA